MEELSPCSTRVSVRESIDEVHSIQQDSMVSGSPSSGSPNEKADSAVMSSQQFHEDLGQRMAKLAIDHKWPKLRPNGLPMPQRSMTTPGTPNENLFKPGWNFP